MSTIEQDKRDQKSTTRDAISTSTGSSEDSNEKNDGPPDLNTTFFPENSGGNGSGNGGENPSDLNTTFSDDGKMQVDRERAKSEYKDQVAEYGFSEPPSYEDSSAQTDQSIAQENTADLSAMQEKVSDKSDTNAFSQNDANQAEPPSYTDRSEQTDAMISSDNQSGSQVDATADKSADATVDTIVETPTETASEPITTSSGQDKPYL